MRRSHTRNRMRSAIGLFAAALLSGCASRALPAQSARMAAVRADTASHAYRPGFDVLDYDLSLELPERGNEIHGRAVLTVRRTALIDTLLLDLLKLDVDSVAVNGVRSSYQRRPETIVIPLPRGSTDTLHVAVSYHGAVEDGLIVRTDSAGRWTGFGDN